VITQPQPLRAVQELLSACDLAVAPRTREPGFPIKVLNAMAASKACVMYASSSRDLRHKQDAYLVTPDTAEALAEGMLEVLTDRELRERLARNGRAYVEANHDRRLIAARMSEVYLRMVLGGEAPKSVRPTRVPSFAPAPHHRERFDTFEPSALSAENGNREVTAEESVTAPNET
jgi:hypothetical protein